MKFNKLILNCIYVSVMIMMTAMILFRGTNIRFFNIIYHFSNVAIIFLNFVYMIFRRKKIIDILECCIIAFAGTLLGISFFTSSIYIPYTFIDILNWILLFWVFYDYSQIDEIPIFIKKTILLCYIIIILLTFNLIKIHVSGNGNGGYVIFPSYFCLTVLPLVLVCLDGKKAKGIAIIIGIATMFATTKRTGSLAILLGGIVYYITNFKMEVKGKIPVLKYLRYMLYIVVITFVGYKILQNLNLPIIQRIQNLLNDGGNGRDNIWSYIISEYKISSIEEKIFGHGFQSVKYVLKPKGINRFAHCSYIEYLYDYGIVGLGMLILFCGMLIKKGIKMNKARFALLPIFNYSLVIAFFLSMFSYFFEESVMTCPIAIAWGYCIGRFKVQQSKCRIE